MKTILLSLALAPIISSPVFAAERTVHADAVSVLLFTAAHSSINVKLYFPLMDLKGERVVALCNNLGTLEGSLKSLDVYLGADNSDTPAVKFIRKPVNEIRSKVIKDSIEICDASGGTLQKTWPEYAAEYKALGDQLWDMHEELVKALKK